MTNIFLGQPDKYRVWQEGCDGRQGEVEGPGEVGVGEALLGVLRQQGVEGGLVVLILVLVLLDKADQGTKLAGDQLEVRLALVVESICVLEFCRQLRDPMDNLLLRREIGGGVEEEDGAKEDGEEAEADDEEPFQAAVAHLPVGGREEGAGAEVDCTGENKDKNRKKILDGCSSVVL